MGGLQCTSCASWLNTLLGSASRTADCEIISDDDARRVGKNVFQCVVQALRNFEHAQSTSSSDQPSGKERSVLFLPLSDSWNCIFLAAGCDSFCRMRCVCSETLLSAATVEAEEHLAKALLSQQSSAKLHCAAKSGDVGRVWALLSTGACTDAEDQDGLVPLHYAADMGHAAVARLLLHFQADLDVPYSGANIKAGWTPLHFAAYSGAVDVVQMLLRHDAELNVEDACRRTPLYHARIKGHTQCVAVLEALGACGDTHLRPVEAEYVCPECCLLFNTQHMLARHRRKQHNVVPPSLSSRPGINPPLLPSSRGRDGLRQNDSKTQ